MASAAISFTGSATDQEGQDISYTWDDYSHIQNATSSLSTEQNITNYRDFTPGSHTITLTAIDTFGASSSKSITIGVATNTLPLPTITSPAAAKKWYFVGAPVSFAGYATDLETTGGYVASTSQSWSITGPNNYDLTATTSFTLAFTEPGTYTIELTASDTLDAESSAQRTLYINATPTVAITDGPLEGTRFSRNESFSIKADAGSSLINDTLTIQWWDRSTNLMLTSIPMTSPTDTYTFATTTSGIHQIEARIIDSCGIATSATRSILINDLPIPGMTFNFPQYATAPGNIPILLATGTPISLSVWATDFERGGNLSANQISCRFYSEICNGTPISLAYASGTVSITDLNLDPGRYHFTVEAIDDNGATTATTSTFVVWRSVERLGGTLNNPSSIFLDGSDFYISDTGHAHLKQYNSDFSSLINTIGSGGTALGSFTSLVGATKSVDKLYTLESLAPAFLPATFSRIQVWDSSLATESHFGDYGTGGQNTASYSHAAAITANNNYLYITDTGAHRIKKLSKTDGKAITVLPFSGTSSGNGVGQFNTPLGIRSIGTLIYVADYGNDRIVPLSDTLSGSTSWLASNPTDIAQFGSSYFVTCDIDGNRIQFLNSEGHWQMNAGSTGTELGQFRNPVSIAKLGSNLIVLERQGGRVQIFSMPSDNDLW